MEKIEKKFLGIELGSTRIKAMLIDEGYSPAATGTFDWESSYEDGFWTYSLDDAWSGIQSAYAKLAEEYRLKYGEELSMPDGLCISAMMHGYLAFDKDWELLTPFRTWRNTTTEEAAAKLTERFGFNIPQRWSIAHLYQAILDSDPHVGRISFITTLAGYVHRKLSGENVLGIGDASGMFPVDSHACGYDATMADSFRSLTGIDIGSVFPKVLTAGRYAGELTDEGARLLDPGGTLKPGVPMCPPEGDAGTGMVATNSIAARTGNISAGTSVFAMVVLEKPLSGLYTEIDMVTTPAGLPVAMVHCNSCTSDLDAWVKIFGEAASLMGAEFSMDELYNALYSAALRGDPDGGGLMVCNYYTGEPITGFEQGRPLFARQPDSPVNLANFMRASVYAAIATLSIGMDILTKRERINLDVMLGHGGFFKTPGAGQKLMASALDVPVAVRSSAAEGGAWGAALLAAFAEGAGGKPLEQFLGNVFERSDTVIAEPDADDTAGFKIFMDRYVRGLEIERAAVKNLL